MAMALGLGFSSPPAVLGCGSLLDHPGICRSRRFVVVRAVNEEDSHITSMRDKSSSTLAKRFLAWGREIHQQATQQMQKFFHELADGSILISFGAPAVATPAKSSDVVLKAHTRPTRPPSRYSKEFPYTTRRTKKHTGTELLMVPSSVEKKLPARVPSTFAKKSPISGGGRRKQKKQSEGSVVSADEAVPVLAFKEILVEEEEATATSKLSRPRTTFARKSPIPDERKSTTVGGKKKVKAFTVEQQTLDAVSSGEVGTKKNSRPATAFVRKSPISLGKVRRQLWSSTPKVSCPPAASTVEAPVSPGSSSNGRLSRPTSAFTRRTPITPGNGSNRRRRPTKTSSSSDSAVKPEISAAVSGDSKSNEDHKSRLHSRPQGTFARKSPVGRARRKRRGAKKDSEAETISATGLHAAVHTEEASVVTEVLVETPTDVITIGLGEKEVAIVEATRIDDGEPGSVLVEQTEKISTDLIPEAILRSVEIADTDIELSDDDTAATDETDLSTLTIQRLRGIAKSRGLRGYSRLRKAELIELLRKS